MDCTGDRKRPLPKKTTEVEYTIEKNHTVDELTEWIVNW